MVSMIVILILVTVLVVLAIIIYKLVYMYKINKKIQSDDCSGGKLLDLSKMVMLAVIVGLVVYAGLLMYIVNDYANQDYSVSRNNYAVIDVSNPDNYRYVSYFGGNGPENASYAKVYKKDANEGYSKEVIESGEYIFTVFKRTSPADSFHPDFLCFAQFVGTDNDEYMCYNKSGFQAIEQEGYFQGETAGDITDCLLYIGYLEEDCAFHISMNLLDDSAVTAYDEAMHNAYLEDKGEFPSAEEYAVSTGSVSIIVNE